MIEPKHETISVRRQCVLLEVNRSVIYRRPRVPDLEDIRLVNILDELYTKRPYYGASSLFRVGKLAELG